MMNASYRRDPAFISDRGKLLETWQHGSRQSQLQAAEQYLNVNFMHFIQDENGDATQWDKINSKTIQSQ